MGETVQSAGPTVPIDETPRFTRRSVLAGASLLGLALLAGVDLTACTGSPPRYTALTAHEHAVVKAATARIIPGPKDDPSEFGHPGAREANVAGYIDGLLGAMYAEPPLVWAGGPFSNRDGSSADYMANFLPLTDNLGANWKLRVDRLLAAYQVGVRSLDQLAGGDFANAPAAHQDAMLAKDPPVAHLPSGMKGFTDLLFQHAIEGCYAVPEYGGNANQVCWHDIGFPGDMQPLGFSADQVSRSDGPDPCKPTGVVGATLKLLESTGPNAPQSPAIVGPGQHS